MRAALELLYPQFAYSEMDGACYWKSLERHEPGDHITHAGKEYTVLYSWAWWNPGVQVYMAELDPSGGERGRVRG